MKKTVILILIWFLIIIFIPLICVLAKGEYTQPPQKEQAANTIESPPVYTTSEYSDDTLILVTSQYCNESFCDEGIRGVSAVIRNNLEAGYDYNTDNTEISDEFYDRIKTICKSKLITLKYNNKTVYIPITKLSEGCTRTTNEYPYMETVASPWDMSSNDYIYGKEYAEGISAYGINYLCENSGSASDALKWYLPEFSVS